MAEKKRSYDGGIYTAEMGAPPMDVDMGSAPPPTKKQMERNKALYRAQQRVPLKEAPRDLMPEDFVRMEREQQAKKKKKEQEKKKMAVGGSVMTPKQQKKVSTVMKEFKAGSLHSGKGGKVVKNPKQAVAISLSEARRLKK